MTVREILSAQNPRLKEFAKIRKNPGHDRFFIEGTRFVEELPAECIREVFTTDTEKHAAFLSRLPEAAEVYKLSPQAMKKICAATSDQTIACTVRRETVQRPDKLVLLDRVQDPGNVGTILRTAYAFGFGVILSPGCANPWSAKTLAATAGAFRSCYVEESKNLLASLSALKADGFSVFATALDKTALPPEQIRFGEKRAVIIGSEGQGIDPALREASDQTVFLPMLNPINSLNAASAASILIYLFR